ncbi:MAG: hypothetical protein BRD49_04225 [Bacteroidetes bacterium SW_10_40_5]|nr:MAG: hypothetical protein BRD49_04225 [Bacteroidetes bacterium SW_10_40_5]
MPQATKNDRLNIIIYIGGFHFPSFIVKLAEHLSKNGHQVAFMGHSTRFKSFKVYGIRYYSLPLQANSGHLITKTLLLFGQLLLLQTASFYSILRTIKSKFHQKKGRKNLMMDFIRLATCKLIQPDLIHNQWSPALASLEPLFEHYPIVQSLHGRLEDITPFHDPIIANIYKKFFPQVKGFQSDSQHLLDNASLFGAKNENRFVSYSLIEKEQIKKQATKGPPDSTLHIISIGKFAWRKGFIYALDAMAILKAHGIPFHYTIIGWDDPTAVELKSNLLHDETLGQLKQVDLFLLPSVEEGFATVVSEAMALEKPVISTNCGGMGELIVNHKNGWLIPTRNPEAIAAAIEHFLQLTPEEVESVTQNARQLAEDQLTWEHQIDKFINLYQNSLKQ